MPKDRLESQVVVRISAPLRSELERAAEEDCRTLADKVRLVLTDYAARRAKPAAQSAAT
ncbi:MAG TPA: hypothetical protein VK749_15940 [Xanthobacteraceae bacterium]|jgi:hypothetical protein|nr:hypothetical protein [Xanthobacteraceae bacterium]